MRKLTPEEIKQLEDNVLNFLTAQFFIDSYSESTQKMKECLDVLDKKQRDIETED